MPEAQPAQTARDVYEVRQHTTPRGVRYYDVHHTRFTAEGVREVEKPARLLSVTTLISRGLPKGALINWAKRYTAEKAVELAEQVAELKAKGEGAAAVDMLKAAPDRRRDIAAELGTGVHQVVERLGQIETVQEAALVVEAADPELRPYLAQFIDFCLVVQPTFIHSEVPVWSIRRRYAGTTDAVVEIDGRRGILDLKTGSVYSDAALQLTAYRHAEHLLPAGSMEPVALESLDLEAGWVLDLKPDGWRLVEVECGAPILAVFDCVRFVGQRWTYALEDEVMGDERSGQAPIVDWGEGAAPAEEPVP